MAELIPWAEVPEGHYVWARNKSRSGEWFLVSKVDGRCRVDIGTVLNTNLYEFARAEQQPGDAAYWHAESTKDCKRADKAEADLATLRAGIAALDADGHIKHYKWCQCEVSSKPCDCGLYARLASLRDGRS